ncbi:MAG TPA: hypothetical protein VJM11_04460, partial [Nevskiaceae bacterium]|nr:hypothetical protein [Nevskiaceae bacterium]
MAIRVRAWLVGIGFGLAGACVVHAADAPQAAAPKAAPKPVPVEDFVKKPKYFAAKISPDGSYVAVTLPAGELVTLGTIDLKNFKPGARLTFPKGERPWDFWWVGNRLVAQVATTYGALDQPALTGELYAVDADGRNQTYLFGYKSQGGSTRIRTAESGWARVLDARILSPKALLIGIDRFADSGDRGAREIRKLDAQLGGSQFVNYVPLQHPFSVTFAANGQPLLAEGEDENGLQRIQWLDASGNEKIWRDAIPPEPNVHRSIMLRAQTDDPTQVWYKSDEGGDRLCLRRFDLGKTASSMVSCDARVDIGAVFLSPSNERPVAAYYDDGLPRTEILDPGSPDGRMIQMLERSFEGQRVRITSDTQDGNRMIVLVQSDRNPGDFYIFDRTTKKADYLMSLREWIDPDQMRPMEPIRYKTRDGATIDGYLTRPAGDPKGLVPLVLMPHGGPHGARDYWA